MASLFVHGAGLKDSALKDGFIGYRVLQLFLHVHIHIQVLIEGVVHVHSCPEMSPAEHSAELGWC